MRTHTFKGAYGDWIFVLPAALKNYSVTSLGPCNYYRGQDLDIPMAATEDNSIILRVDDEVEGERRGSDDCCFIGIGEAIPIKPGDDAEFDPQNPPSKPLSVSERFGLIFVSHSTGFCVARTKDIIDSAKEIAGRGSGSSIKELSVVDVPIGQVYILALSADSSTLAACIDGKIHIFSVASLLNKDQRPFFSCSLDDSSCVEDMQWTKKLENYYAVLSNHGNLYYGAGQDPLKNVMDDVDAFDSIRWVRPDSIILGCFQLTSDGKEENYLVQVIASKDGKFTNTSSKPIVLSFSDVFEAFVDDIVPFGSGPYMSLSYLSTCELAITANRKSTDQHIVLFSWSLDDRKEAAVFDIVRDTLCPKIALQGNGDDNIVLGLCVDRISQNEKVAVQLGAEYKELSPFCILLCLSLDGKLFMYQVASVTGPSVPPDDVSLLSDEEDDTPTLVSSEDGKPSTSGGFVSESVQVGLGFQSQGVDKKELLMKEGNGIPVTNGPMRPVKPERLETLRQQKFLVTKVDPDTVGQQSLLSAPQGPYFGHLSPKTSYLEEPGPVVIDFIKEETKKLPDFGIMTGVLMENFPDLIKSNPPSLGVSDLEVSMVSPKVDIIDMLQKASVPNFATDGSAAKQIKELSAEVTKLKWLLEEKEKLSVSEQPVPRSSWKDKVTGASSSSRMTLEFFPPIVDEVIATNPNLCVAPSANVVVNSVVGEGLISVSGSSSSIAGLHSVDLDTSVVLGNGTDVVKGSSPVGVGPSSPVVVPMSVRPVLSSSETSQTNELTLGSLGNFGIGLESPFHYSPAPNVNAEVFHSDTAARKSHSGSLTSSSPMLSTSSSPSSAPVLSSLLLPSSLPYPTEKTSSLSISIGRSSTSSKPGTYGSQTALLSQSSSSSSSFLSSVSSFQVLEKAVPSAIPISSMNFETESPKREQHHPIPKLTFPTEESSTVQSSSPKNEPGFTFKLESSLPFRPGGEPSANLQSVSKPTFDGMANHTMNAALNSKLGLSFTRDVSAALLSMSGSASGGKSESANVAVTQEDEMDEEAPETSQTNELTLGSLGSFGIGSSPNPTPGKPNPFGGAFGSVVSTPATSPFNRTAWRCWTWYKSLFRKWFQWWFDQLSFHWWLASSTGGGFAGAASPGGGFAAAASAGGGFAAAASAGGGFSSGRFGGITAAGGGFAAPASAGGGFAGAAFGSGFPCSGGGFGAFNSQQGSGGFSAFGSSAGGTGRPPSPLFTHMRK
ncbi:hypothetical protein RHMOL_Rhmol13G0275200 [Rhododendron molle]|uniref:Uncharacterized protein n=1 Tax=Rhododendron molle TaxID=49168 RepID=A0ACC0LBJ4_RHOML|nr:hypothetical protein RHMOL_Rhmol13G0275200 [Rhododendron molle]